MLRIVILNEVKHLREDHSDLSVQPSRCFTPFNMTWYVIEKQRQNI
jgi:hypothetical protein